MLCGPTCSAAASLKDCLCLLVDELQEQVEVKLPRSGYIASGGCRDVYSMFRKTKAGTWVKMGASCIWQSTPLPLPARIARNNIR